MPDRLSLKFAGAAFLLAFSAGFSSPAHAGFQWVAPNDATSAPPMGSMQELRPAPSYAPPVSLPMAPTAAPEIISPVVISGNNAMADAKVSAKSVAVNAADNAVVMGFARSVPLAVALRQILPSGYAFSIDQDVDMGTLVSFQGGHSWRDTLRDALAPAGLVTREQGQMVAVGFAAHNLVPAATAPETKAELPYQKGMGPKSLTFADTVVSPAAVAPVPAEAVMPMDSGKSADMAAALPEPWTAERGEHLRRVLEDWAKRANVEFDWLSEYDYPLEASVSYTGNFEGAVRNLLMGFENAHPQPVAELHANANLGQMVLIVQTRGNTNSD